MRIRTLVFAPLLADHAMIQLEGGQECEQASAGARAERMGPGRILANSA